MRIRESIEIARQHEHKCHSLEQYLQEKLPSLHRSINLPEENASAALVEFVTRYIEHVPDMVEAIREMTKNAGIYDFARGFLAIAEDYFIKPPELLHQHEGLHLLIDEAYLAHRLMEEVNDRVMMKCGVPLAPIDMTISNIVIHDVLGESFANELDMAVHYSIEALVDFGDFVNNEQFQIFVNAHRNEGWDKDIAQWPCLAGDSSISLELMDVSNALDGNTREASDKDQLH